jgi:hypothetical protein
MEGIPKEPGSRFFLSTTGNAQSSDMNILGLFRMPTGLALNQKKEKKRRRETSSRSIYVSDQSRSTGAISHRLISMP